MAVVSLFDYTGVMVEPWRDAGHECVIVDIQHPPGWSRREDGVWRWGGDVREFPGIKSPMEFMAAFPPCDHLAVSGARWFKGKGLRLLAQAIELFAEAAERCEASGAPYMIENPVSTIATYWRKPDHVFQPWNYCGLCPADEYTKTTCLWTGGGFLMPEPCHPDDVEPDDRIHRAAPGPERANFRSATPRGFAMAVYQANALQYA